MFHKPFRDKLRKKSWMEAAGEGNNESQEFIRKKKLVSDSIADLKLLYEKLPEKKRDEIYNLSNLKPLFDALLSDDLENITKLEIANYTANKTLNFFKKKYGELNIDSPTSTELISDLLDKSLNICNEITYKEQLKIGSFELPNEKMEYLGRWNELTKGDKQRFKRYIESMVSFTIKKLLIIFVKPDIEIKGSYKEITGSFEDEMGTTYNLHLTINEDKDKSFLRISNDSLTASQTFLVRYMNRNYLLYFKKSTAIVSHKPSLKKFLGVK